MPASSNAEPASPDRARPSNREVETENQRPASSEGKAPRPATEPRATRDSSDSPKTRTDPGSGET